MNMDIDTVVSMLTKVAIFSPITIGLVQVVKVAGAPSQYLPIIAVLIGVCFGVFFVAASTLGVLAGIVLGLSAVGLYEFGATGVKGVISGQ